MASRHEDSKAYKSWEAKTARAADKIGGTLSSIWENMEYHPKNSYTYWDRFSIALVLTIAAAGGAGLEYAVSYEKEGSVTEAPTDFDLSGSSLASHAYSYKNHEGEYYMLIRDEGRYELYAWNHAGRHPLLISNFHAAQSIINEIDADTKIEIDTMDLSPEETHKGTFRTCDSIGEAFQKEDGGITRHYNSCPMVKDQSAEQLLEIYQENWDFWHEAAQNLTEASYGPLDQDITRYAEGEVTSTTEYKDLALRNALIGFGGWLSLGMAGASLSGVRRRAEKKTGLNL
jgi:hypothetical protein